MTHETRAYKPSSTADCPPFIPTGWRNVVIFNGGGQVEEPEDPQKKKLNCDIHYVVPKTTDHIHDPRNQFVVPQTTA